jgi:hypothetical protein
MNELENKPKKLPDHQAEANRLAIALDQAKVQGLSSLQIARAIDRLEAYERKHGVTAQ